MTHKLTLAAILAAAAVGGVAYAGGPRGDFSRFDEDGDGKVAVDEIDAHHKEFIAKADADGDGFITKDEMDAMHKTRRAEMKARRFPDANGDSKVDRREFEDAARSRFDELDANGDGLLTEDEMEKHHRGHRR